MRRTGGFTLIELVAALTLFALLAAIAFGIMGSATRAAAGGERLAESVERVRVAQEFLRRQLAFALPLAFASDPASGTPVIFEGEERGLSFVAQMPGHLGEGGPRRQRITLERDGRAWALVFRHLPLHPAEEGARIEEVEPVVLLAGIRDGRFRYRGVEAAGEPGDWRDRWEETTQPPVWVEVLLELDPEAHRVRWPELVVALQVDGVPGGAFLFGPAPGGVDFGPRPPGGGGGR